LEIDADGTVPFPDLHFDLVVSNQVIEHVANLEQLVAELARITKPSGCVLALFPTREVMREGHIGIPFAHWFTPGSTLRRGYVVALRASGFGYFKQGRRIMQWCDEMLQWLDQYTHYRPLLAVERAFSSHFDTTGAEADYIRYRMRRTRSVAWLSPLLSVPPIESLAVSLFRRLAGVVLVASRRVVPSQAGFDVKGS
jgi:SAM-dependent methyltransferase